jgi:hypothetical protein
MWTVSLEPLSKADGKSAELVLVILGTVTNRHQVSLCQGRINLCFIKCAGSFNGIKQDLYLAIG